MEDAAEAVGRDRGRGQHAARPTAIPLRGWGDILLRTIQATMRHEAPTLAAAIAFYGVLAFIPALSAAASLYVLLSDASAGARQLSALKGVVPDASLELIVTELGRLSTERWIDRLWIAAGSLVAVVGSVNAAVMALLFGLNVAYEEQERRSFLGRALVAAGFTAVLLVMALAAFGSLLVGRVVATEASLPSVVVQSCRFAFLGGATTGVLALLYRYGPSRGVARWRWVTPGGLLAAGAWLASSSALSFYLAHFAHYERAYGILGTVLAVMAWLWTAAMIALLGAELNAQTEAQTKRNTAT